MVEVVIVEASGLSPNEYEEAVEAGRAALRSHISESGGARPSKAIVTKDEEWWVVTFEGLKPDIARTRRITGYLSNLNNFNYSKKAEEKDRVAHT